MGIRGDFNGFQKLEIELSKAGELIRSGEMAAVLAETARDLVDEGFATGTAPDGTPWKELAMRDGQPLRDTRRLQGSFTYDTKKDSFSVGTDVEYAAIHQNGGTVTAKGKALAWKAGGKMHFAKSVTIVARPMLPGKYMPARWSKAMRDAANDLVEETVGQ